MTDDELESLLRRVRPANPGVTVRARVLAAAAGRPPRVTWSAWDWGIAAAAAVMLTMWAVTNPDDARPAPVPDEVAWQTAVEQVAGAMGGDARARERAEVRVPRPESVKSYLPEDVSW